MSRDPSADFQAEAEFPQRDPGRALMIGLIDPYRFSQDCLVRALQTLHPSDMVLSFATIEECVAAERPDFDLVIYYLHENGAGQAKAQFNVATLHRVYPSVQLVVLSDADENLQAEASRKILESGASGFVPTRTTSIFMTIGAIRFAKEGGAVTRPEELVPTPRRSVLSNAHQPKLTSREMAVLGLLQRGKANKIIAHELCMSENTVKIHVRNIMRKLDATNRMQAVDKARALWGRKAHQADAATPRPRWCRRKGMDRRMGQKQGGQGEHDE
jgi:DNA-binding NarL/FixJ family response regulator